MMISTEGQIMEVWPLLCSPRQPPSGFDGSREPHHSHHRGIQEGLELHHRPKVPDSILGVFSDSSSGGTVM